jgi:hypothetical protein
MKVLFLIIICFLMLFSQRDHTGKLGFVPVAKANLLKIGIDYKIMDMNEQYPLRANVNIMFGRRGLDSYSVIDLGAISNYYFLDKNQDEIYLLGGASFSLINESVTDTLNGENIYLQDSKIKPNITIGAGVNFTNGMYSELSYSFFGLKAVQVNIGYYFEIFKQ